MLGWIEAGYPIVVSEDEAGQIVAWASASPYRPNRAAYSGVAEFSIYVARAARGQGAGSVTLAALISEAEGRGYWKLVSRIFPENEGHSRSAARSASERSASTAGTRAGRHVARRRDRRAPARRSRRMSTGAPPRNQARRRVSRVCAFQYERPRETAPPRPPIPVAHPKPSFPSSTYQHSSSAW